MDIEKLGYLVIWLTGSVVLNIILLICLLIK